MTIKPEFDAELAALPAPPRADRASTSALLVVTALVALLVAAGVYQDAAYASTNDATVLDDFGSPTLRSNTFVHAKVLLGAGGGVRFERPLRDQAFRLLPVLALQDGREKEPKDPTPLTQGRALWVEVEVPKSERVNPTTVSRFVPQEAVTGRLLRLDQGGLAGLIGGSRHGDVRELAARLNPERAGEVWMIAADETPSSVWKSAWLFGLCLLVAGFCLISVVRLRAPLRRAT
jgi:hypothetical protein